MELYLNVSMFLWDIEFVWCSWTKHVPYSCVCIHVCVQACMHMHDQECEGQKLMPGVFLSLSPLVFLWCGLSLNLELIFKAWLSGQWAAEIWFSDPSRFLSHQALEWMLMSSCFQSRLFTHGAIFPPPALSSPHCSVHWGAILSMESTPWSFYLQMC